MAIKKTVLFLLLIMSLVAQQVSAAEECWKHGTCFFAEDLCPGGWEECDYFCEVETDKCCCLKAESCPDGWVQFESSCYYIDSTLLLEQSEARQTCQNLGGDLPIINSDEQNQFIADLISKQEFVAYFGAWIGLERKAQGSPEFVWIDGTPLGEYSAWASSEPNNASGSENCVTFVYGSSWNDLSCDYSGPYGKPVVVCQKPAN